MTHSKKYRRYGKEIEYPLKEHEMSRKIDTALGEIELPWNTKLIGTVQYDLTNMTKITKNRVLKAVGTGVCTVVGGQAGSHVRTVCSLFNLPVVYMSGQGSGVSIVVENLEGPTQLDIVETAMKMFFSKGNGIYRSPDSRHGRAAIRCYQDKGTSYDSMVTFMETYMKEQVSEEAKATRIMVAKAIEDGCAITIGMPGGKARVIKAKEIRPAA